MVIDLYIDGERVGLKKAFNSRGHGAAKTTQGACHSCFLGFYYDASHVSAGTSHDLAIHLPTIPPGSFQGLFWENVETHYTSEVKSCRLHSSEASSTVYI